MSYTIGDDGLLDFSDCKDDEEKLNQCWEYFVDNLSSVKIVAFDGKPVRGFTKVSFDHIVSGSTNKYDTALDHDIPFVEKRAARLPLIPKVIKGELKSRVYRTAQKRGKKTTIRRTLTVIEFEHQYYIVILDEIDMAYRIRTAYPTNKTYFEHRVRGKGINDGIWG